MEPVRMLLFSVFACFLTVSPGTTGKGPRAHCEPTANIPFCAGMWYNETRFPNLLGHRTSRKAIRRLRKDFFGNKNSRCQLRSLRTYLCLLYAPPCGDTILPCPDLCEFIQNQCPPDEDLRTNKTFACPNLNYDESERCVGRRGQIERTVEMERILSMQGTRPLPGPPYRCEETNFSVCRRVADQRRTLLPNWAGQHSPRTLLPNWAGQDNQRDAATAFIIANRMLNPSLECRRPMERFLCAVYFPECRMHTRATRPCRELCHAAKRCSDSQRLDPQFTGFSEWPEHLQCDKFPQSTTPCAGSQEPDNQNATTPFDELFNGIALQKFEQMLKELKNEQRQLQEVTTKVSVRYYCAEQTYNNLPPYAVVSIDNPTRVYIKISSLDENGATGEECEWQPENDISEDGQSDKVTTLKLQPLSASDNDSTTRAWLSQENFVICPVKQTRPGSGHSWLVEAREHRALYMRDDVYVRINCTDQNTLTISHVENYNISGIMDAIEVTPEPVNTDLDLRLVYESGLTPVTKASVGDEVRLLVSYEPGRASHVVDVLPNDCRLTNSLTNTTIQLLDNEGCPTEDSPVSEFHRLNATILQTDPFIMFGTDRRPGGSMKVTCSYFFCFDIDACLPNCTKNDYDESFRRHKRSSTLRRASRGEERRSNGGQLKSQPIRLL